MKIITIGIPIQMDIDMPCIGMPWNNFELWGNFSPRIISNFSMRFFLNRTSFFWKRLWWRLEIARTQRRRVRFKRVGGCFVMILVRNDKKLSSNWWICTISFCLPPVKPTEQVLPIHFIIEDNSKSVCTDTRDTWNCNTLSYERKSDPMITYYRYETKYPHAGAGIRVQF